MMQGSEVADKADGWLEQTTVVVETNYSMELGIEPLERHCCATPRSTVLTSNSVQ